MSDKNFSLLLDLVSQQSPQKADVIVWLQGDRFDRGPKTVELFRDGLSPLIMVTGNNILIGPEKRIGENNISIKDMVAWLLTQGIPKEKILTDDKSMNTREQAIKVFKEAERHTWKKIIIVGSAPHYQFRAFLTFLRRAKETAWPCIILNQPVILDWGAIPGGRKKTCREIFENEVKKLTNYYTDVASINEGIEYLKGFSL